jgi:hypothetical protein
MVNFLPTIITFKERIQPFPSSTHGRCMLALPPYIKYSEKKNNKFFYVQYLINILSVSGNQGFFRVSPG